MKNRIKVHKRLNLYFTWPLIVIAFFAALAIGLFFVSVNAGIVAIICTAVYAVAVIIIHLVNRKKMVHELVEFAEEYSQVQGEFIKDLVIPYGILDGYGQLLWMNTRMAEMTDNKLRENRSFLSEFKDITLDDLDFETEKVINLVHNDKNYRVELKKLIPPEDFKGNKVLNLNVDRPYFVAVYFFDETQMKKMQKEIVDQQMVTGLIYLDNYEEILNEVEDVRRALLIGLLDRKITGYFFEMDGIVRKLEKDRYFIAFKRQYLSGLQSNKFEILDEIKEVNIGNDNPVTISIGIGVGGSGYNQNCDFARAAIDLALGRGGDQAVVKEGEKIYYYGGKSKSVEKNTKVKARVKAHALKQILLEKDKVIIMGHRVGDIDSFGASIGLFKAAKAYGKRAYIIINETTTTVKPIIELFNSDEDYLNDTFIDEERAKELIDETTVLAVVDTSKPEIVECPELLALAKSIVVVDHHRQSSSIIENPVLSYIEPFASSASEMVTELLQYVSDSIKLKKIEAEALYAGILIDTNYFSTNTGVRTFEAAAYLKKMGADITRVRELFRDDLSDFKAKAEAITKAEIFDDQFAITECPSVDIESPTVVVAQTANDLLSINNVKASFVLTDYNNKIYISARSTGELNVQLVMERIGGGGHMNTAGAQLSNCTINEAKRIIKETVKKMMEEGDL